MYSSIPCATAVEILTRMGTNAASGGGVKTALFFVSSDSRVSTCRLTTTLPLRVSFRSPATALPPKRWMTKLNDRVRAAGGCAKIG